MENENAGLVETSTINGGIELTIAGNDYYYSFDQLSLANGIDSSNDEVLNAVENILRENNISLKDTYGEFTYTTRKALNTGVIHVYPNSEKG